MSSESLGRIDWAAIRGMMEAPRPEPAAPRSPPPKRTRYHRAYGRRRRGYIGRVYVTWPSDVPEGKREQIRREARDRLVPVRVVQEEWGIWG
jgi:hypothetical protein